MKRDVALLSLALLLALAATACVHQVVVRDPMPYPASPPPSRYPVGASEAVLTFYDDLEPHGSWIRVEGPGWVWQPSGVAVDWRPYTLGRWVYTDYGWTWASDEGWGWATYHYGRWHHSPRHGWVWVPGSDWGPAWVTWNSGGDWVGWAPLPWQVEWRAGVGLEWGRVDVRVAVEPAWWCFVPLRRITDPRPSQYYAPVSRNVSLVRITHNVTNYTIIDQRVVNQSVQVNLVSKATGRPVQHVKVRHDERPKGPRGSDMQGDELIVYRPARRGADHPSVETQAPPQRTRGVDRSSRPARARTTSPASKEEPGNPEKPARPERPNRYRAPQEARKSNGRPTPRPAHASAPPEQASPAGTQQAPPPDENRGQGDRGDQATHPRGPGRAPVASPAAKSDTDGKPAVTTPSSDRSRSGTARGKPAKPETPKSKKKSDPKSDDDDSKSKKSDTDDTDKDEK